MSGGELEGRRLPQQIRSALGAASATFLVVLAVWWQFSLRPSVAEVKKNLEAGRSVIVLAELQRQYYSRHNVYADGWEPLTGMAKDPQALKRALKATVDMDTLLVKGGGKFRIEANALGRRRKLIRFHGPPPIR